MERRLLLVFALTFLVILAFQPILKKYLPASSTDQARAANPNGQHRRHARLANASFR